MNRSSRRCRLLAAIALGWMTGLATSSVRAQSPAPRGYVGLPPSVQPGVPSLPAAAVELPRYDLDFPGGTPGELVQAIAKAQGAKVNAIIPDEHVESRVPRLNLSHVTTPEVFAALVAASHREGSIAGFGGQVTRYVSTSGFKTAVGGVVTTNTVWTYFVEDPSESTKQPRFETLKVYSLARYLGKPEQGLHSVDDIITAVQTGWKMQKISPAPALTYHPETKLLLAYGQETQLLLIGDVLKQLEPTAVPAPKEKVSPEVLKVLEQGGHLVPKETPKPK